MTEYARRLRRGSRVYDVSDPAVPLTVVGRPKYSFLSRLTISEMYGEMKTRTVPSPKFGPHIVYAVRKPDGGVYHRAAGCLRRIP